MLVYGKCDCFVIHMLYMFVSCVNPVAVLNAPDDIAYKWWSKHSGFG